MTPIDPPSPWRVWLLTLGFGIWCGALVILYALHAIGCGFGWPAGTLRTALIVILLAHLAWLAWLWRRYARLHPRAPRGSTASFLYGVVAWTMIAALVTTFVTLGPVLVLKACI